MAPPPKAPKLDPSKPTPRRAPTRARGDSRAAELWESLRGWRNGILLLVLAAVAFTVSRIDVLRPIAAELFSMAFPVVAVAMAFWAMRAAKGWLRWASIAVAALLVVGAELTLFEVWFPPAPLATVTLSEAHPSATIEAPASMDDFDVQARGSLLSKSGTARGNFEVSLERGGEQQAFTGEFSRVIGSSRRVMTRAAPSRSVVETVIVREEMLLPRRGPVHAKLVNIEGAVHHAVRLTIKPKPSTDKALLYGLIGLTLAALVLEVVAARRAMKVSLVGGAAAAAVIAVYIVREFDPDDPLTTFWGAAVVAVLAGALGGALLGKLATFLFASTPVEPSGPSGPSAPSGGGSTR